MEEGQERDRRIRGGRKRRGREGEDRGEEDKGEGGTKGEEGIRGKGKMRWVKTGDERNLQIEKSRKHQ